MRFALLGLDIFGVVLATWLALLLRENFTTSWQSTWAVFPYLIATVTAASVIFPISGSYRARWHALRPHQYGTLLLAVLLTTAGAVLATTAYNRLDGVVRSIPVLQFMIGSLLLLAFRMGAAIWHRCHMRNRNTVGSPSELMDVRTKTLIVGRTSLTEAYLQAQSELASETSVVVGILVSDVFSDNRDLMGAPVLGKADEIPQVLNDLDLHGIEVDRIVIAMRRSDISSKVADILAKLPLQKGIRVQYLSELLGFETPVRQSEQMLMSAQRDGAAVASFSFDQTACAALASWSYCSWKRGIDVVVALTLLLLLSPIFALMALLVLIDVGWPVIFWQQRPAHAGRTINVYKLRTMTSARTSTGERLADDDRVSAIGKLLRRTRLDELPQLYNVFIGDMSLVGPRPLLAADQPVEHRVRLLVRPGLTGWAQVQGRRNISAADKAALDIWYIKNASFSLDLWILMRTIPVLVFGERTNPEAISRSWRDLRDAGICEIAPLTGDKN